MATLQDLGLVTSYGYAVAGGYIGTVDEYEYYLAHLPQYAQTAGEAATQAAASATADVSEPPRPSVVISPSSVTP